VLLVIGNGFFKPNISTMVGDLYAEGDARRDAAVHDLLHGHQFRGADRAATVLDVRGEP
jgi:dipeptide/tripeptide permease